MPVNIDNLRAKIRAKQPWTNDEREEVLSDLEAALGGKKKVKKPSPPNGSSKKKPKKNAKK
tara:strand:+ start:507 stop:689 length:183 start_codon:yes stop_codon:yes gene_type:complete